MIKVIHFMSSVNFVNGITNLVMNYYRNIDKKEIQFDFLYFGKDIYPNFSDEIKNLGGNIIKVHSPLNYFKFRKELIFYLTSLNSKEEIIFHNHQINFTIFLKPIVLNCGIKKFITHNHMTKYSDKLFSSIRNMFLCFPIKYMDIKYFSCSKEAGIFMFGKKNWLNNKVIIMENGIDCNKYLFNENIREQIRKKYNIKNNFVIGHIGRFEKVKNHEFIIKLFLEVKKKVNNSKLLLVGNGNRKKIIELKILKLGLKDDVIILENRKDISNLLFAMDVFILPSLFEGLGIVALEAQASGLPVIISDKVPEVVKIINCKRISIEKSYIKEWSEEIIKYNTKINYQNRKIVNETVYNSRFNIYKNVKYIENIYKKIVLGVDI